MQAPAQSSGFGDAQAPKASGFGQSMGAEGFGKSSQQFGQPMLTEGFGKPVTQGFGQAAPQGFSQPVLTEGFGKPVTQGFGQPSKPGGFGQPAQSANGFGARIGGFPPVGASNGFGQAAPNMGTAQVNAGFGGGAPSQEANTSNVSAGEAADKARFVESITPQAAKNDSVYWGFGKCLGFLLKGLIPVYGLIVLLLCLFGNPRKYPTVLTNFLRASVIFVFIITCIAFGLTLAFGNGLLSMLTSLGG